MIHDLMVCAAEQRSVILMEDMYVHTVAIAID